MKSQTTPAQRSEQNRRRRWAVMHVTIDRDEREAMRALAAKGGTTLSEVLRAFVTWGLDAEDIHQGRRFLHTTVDPDVYVAVAAVAQRRRTTIRGVMAEWVKIGLREELKHVRGRGARGIESVSRGPGSHTKQDSGNTTR